MNRRELLASLGAAATLPLLPAPRGELVAAPVKGLTVAEIDEFVRECHRCFVGPRVFFTDELLGMEANDENVRELRAGDCRENVQ